MNLLLFGLTGIKQKLLLYALSLGQPQYRSILTQRIYQKEFLKKLIQLYRRPPARGTTILIRKEGSARHSSRATICTTQNFKYAQKLSKIEK